jgi:hypothetical protein
VTADSIESVDVTAHTVETVDVTADGIQSVDVTAHTVETVDVTFMHVFSSDCGYELCSKSVCFDPQLEHQLCD